ncbi:unnamed protein product [Scytosiphon promiscuus]
MAIQSAVMFFALMFLGRGDAFVHVASMPDCSCRTRATTTMVASSPSGGGGEGTGMTRAQAIQRAAAGSGVLAAGILLGGSAQARAEEAEMKDEVQQFAELRGQVEKRGRDEVTKENLVALTQATAGLKTLDTYIGEKDYPALRLALRNPPIGNLRASARKVIINMDNKDDEAKATTAYKALISSVDKLDGIANRGMKEKDGLKDDKEILEVYSTCVERGSDLLSILPKMP